MSDEIQAIANNNYVLHNIDAKKLYVQEPLFTANSGDAVYVGWRPDETVLWESDSPSTFYSISPIQLSENISAFERIKIIENPWPDNPVKYVHEFVPNNNLYYSISDSWIGSPADYSNPWIMDNMMSFSAGDKCQYLNDAKRRYNANSVSGPDHSMRIYKVIGINRKENA